MSDLAFFDEEGEEWPPSLCAVARIKDYGGDPASAYNGQLVLISGYDYATQFYSAESTIADPNELLEVGDSLLCTKHELEPLNAYTKAVLESIKEAFSPLPKHRMIHDQLIKVISYNGGPRDVPYYVIESWSDEVESRVMEWALAASQSHRTDRPDPVVPPMPPELEGF